MDAGMEGDGQPQPSPSSDAAVGGSPEVEPPAPLPSPPPVAPAPAPLFAPLGAAAPLDPAPAAASAHGSVYSCSRDMAADTPLPEDDSFCSEDLSSQASSFYSGEEESSNSDSGLVSGLPVPPTLAEVWRTMPEQLMAATATRVEVLRVEEDANRTEMLRCKAVHEEAAANLAEKKGRLDQLRTLLREELVQAAAAERLDCQRRVAETDLTLGRVVPGANGGEGWQDGVKAKTAFHRVTEIEAMRQATRAAVRDSTGPPRCRGSDDASSPGQTAECASEEGSPSSADGEQEHEGMLADIQREIQRRQLEAYKVLDQEAREALVAVAAEKQVHVKDSRRVRDEMGSTHAETATLDDGRYVLLDMLGKGGFSEVWRAADIQACTHVAVKIHRLSPDWPAERRAQYLRHTHREYEIQKSAIHERVVRLLGCFEISPTSFATVLEYTPFGDLDSYLKAHGALGESIAKAIMAQILSGLAYLHLRRVIHYDLKPANVLFFSEGEVKLTDFGLSKHINAPHCNAGEDTAIDLTSQGAGTYWYLPPECFDTSRTPRVTTKVDIFSAGVVFYQMLYNRRPFGHGVSQRQVFTDRIMLSLQGVDFPMRKGVSDEAQTLIRRCLSRCHAERPSAVELIEDDYFLGPTKKMVRMFLDDDEPDPMPPPPLPARFANAHPDAEDDGGASPAADPAPDPAAAAAAGAEGAEQHRPGPDGGGGSPQPAGHAAEGEDEQGSDEGSPEGPVYRMAVKRTRRLQSGGLPPTSPIAGPLFPAFAAADADWQPAEPQQLQQQQEEESPAAKRARSDPAPECPPPCP